VPVAVNANMIEKSTTPIRMSTPMDKATFPLRLTHPRRPPVAL
jgi:hypothetical protein